jgi:hypothetical protein
MVCPRISYIELSNLYLFFSILDFFVDDIVDFEKVDSFEDSSSVAVLSL